MSIERLINSVTKNILEIKLDELGDRRLEKLAGYTGGTKREVVVDALKIYEAIIEFGEQGYNVVCSNKDEKIILETNDFEKLSPFRSGDYFKVSIGLTDKLKEKLSDMGEKTNQTPEEVVLKAFAVYENLIKKFSEGYAITYKLPEGVTSVNGRNEVPFFSY